MNDPQRIDDGARYDLPKDPYDMTSTDIVQAQTKARLDREHETYLQQQDRLHRERRHALLSAAIACLIVAATVCFVAWEVWKG